MQINLILEPPQKPQIKAVTSLRQSPGCVFLHKVNREKPALLDMQNTHKHMFTLIGRVNTKRRVCKWKQM